MFGDGIGFLTIIINTQITISKKFNLLLTKINGKIVGLEL